MKSTFEKMGGTYTLGADGIYYPNLISTDEEPHYGKYGIIKSVTYDHGRKNSLPKLRKGHMIWNCNLVLLCPL